MVNTISKYQRNAKRDDDASTWPVTIVESPYAGEIDLNLHYARRACVDCLKRQEVPYASHLFFPQMLGDLLSAEREAGVAAGYALWYSASKVAFYIDRGWSPGMERALKRAQERGFAIEYRTLDKAQT